MSDDLHDRIREAAAHTPPALLDPLTTGRLADLAGAEAELPDESSPDCQRCIDRARRKRNRLPAENADYAAALLRQLRRYGVRVGDGDPEDLTTMLAIRDAFDDVIADAVGGLRDQGWSWARIGRAAVDREHPKGQSRQGVEQRWGG